MISVKLMQADYRRVGHLGQLLIDLAFVFGKCTIFSISCIILLFTRAFNHLRDVHLQNTPVLSMYYLSEGHSRNGKLLSRRPTVYEVKSTLFVYLITHS